MKEVDAFFFDEPTEPLHEFVERNDVIAVIPERRWSDGKLERARLSEVISCIARDRSIERGRFFEIGDEFAKRARVHDRSGELMSADLAGLFEHVNIFGGKRRGFFRGGVLLDEVREMQRAGESRWSCADDQYVRFEFFALNSHG